MCWYFVASGAVHSTATNQGYKVGQKITSPDKAFGAIL